MLSADREILGFRTIALIPFALFAPVVVSFAVAPGVVGFEYVGVLFHLSVLFLVARMDAPEWARAAGYGWLALDVAVGAMMINGVSPDVASPMRLGGHVLAGVWIVTASLLARSVVVRVLGVAGGGWLGLYTFFAPFLPQGALGPAAVLVLAWFVSLAWKYPRPGPVSGA
ncbi:hypothetical protein SAMN05216553_108282 [Lentzea fradiae]|uniref:Uncharacterized protein n=1 Tax=Lentzea fradiae TaxID=200378 RepID=A0A1G7ULJ8_9PSEU|nr:hypothetical protein [Lentzea fradiae]SDG48386.1 hypothetical protein SAMN05216553_108282 [Lentzea fradiae]